MYRDSRYNFAKSCQTVKTLMESSICQLSKHCAHSVEQFRMVRLEDSAIK